MVHRTVVVFLLYLSFGNSYAEDTGWVEKMHEEFALLPIARDVRNSDCPILQGSYLEEGEEISLVKESSASINRVVKTVPPYSLFSHPRVADGTIKNAVVTHKSGEDDSQIRPGVFEVRQTEATLEILRSSPRTDNQIIKITFIRNQLDYSCNNGILYIRESIKEGYSDGSVYSYMSSSAIVKLIDRSLAILKYSRSTSKAFLIASAKRETKSVTKFKVAN